MLTQYKFYMFRVNLVNIGSGLGIQTFKFQYIQIFCGKHIVEFKVPQNGYFYQTTSILSLYYSRFMWESEMK